MVEKLKFMKGKEIVEEDMGPVLVIANIIIVPVIAGFIFNLAQNNGIAHYLAFVVFAGLGYYDWRTSKKK